MTHGDEAAYAPRRPGLHRPTAHGARTNGAGLAGPAERSRTHADADARTRKQRATSTRDLRDSFVQGRARACCKEAAYRYRQRRRTRNINDSSCAFRPKPDPCSRIGHPSAGTDARRQTVRRGPAPSKGTTTSDPTNGTTRHPRPETRSRARTASTSEPMTRRPRPEPAPAPGPPAAPVIADPRILPRPAPAPGPPTSTPTTPTRKAPSNRTHLPTTPPQHEEPDRGSASQWRAGVRWDSDGVT